MSSSHDPVDSLADILTNADRIEGYLDGMDRAAFDADARTRDAVERCLERICEAAYRLGDQAVVLMPTQPWGRIRGMGNRLRHAYDRLDRDIIWNAVHRDLPVLALDARRVLVGLRAADRDAG